MVKSEPQVFFLSLMFRVRVGFISIFSYLAAIAWVFYIQLFAKDQTYVA